MDIIDVVNNAILTNQKMTYTKMMRGRGQQQTSTNQIALKISSELRDIVIFENVNCFYICSNLIDQVDRQNYILTTKYQKEQKRMNNNLLKSIIERGDKFVGHHSARTNIWEEDLATNIFLIQIVKDLGCSSNKYAELKRLTERRREENGMLL